MEAAKDTASRTGVIVLYELYIDSLREKLTLDVVLDEEAPFILKVVGVDDYDVI